MKHIIILGDGMADTPIGELGGKTPLEYARTPYMDLMARNGRTGMLTTIPDGFQPGSEVANTSILGYDLGKVYEGRGPLEAASIGYEMNPGDLAMRCNIVCLENGRIKNHHGGHLETADGAELVKFLDRELGGDKVKFIPGIQYRHLLVVKGGDKCVDCSPPHDNPGREWGKLLPNAQCGEAEETAELLRKLIRKSQEILPEHPINKERKARGKDLANSIWPWSGGYRPDMLTLQEMYPGLESGAVISAVDLIMGIGHYAGLRKIWVEGATGLADTNYEGKAAAALEALKTDDFVFLHIEASDEAGHDGDLPLKIETIENLDRRIVKPVYEEVKGWDEPVCIAVLPDHPTPVETRAHSAAPVPFLIWHKGITPDKVVEYGERSCLAGGYGHIRLRQFMDLFMGIR